MTWIPQAPIVSLLLGTTKNWPRLYRAPCCKFIYSTCFRVPRLIGRLKSPICCCSSDVFPGFVIFAIFFREASMLEIAAARDAARSSARIIIYGSCELLNVRRRYTFNIYRDSHFRFRFFFAFFALLVVQTVPFQFTRQAKMMRLSLGRIGAFIERL